MTMLTSSLVSDSIVDTFVVVYKFAFDISFFSLQGHCNLLYSDHSNNWVSIIFGVRISIQSQFQYKILMNRSSTENHNFVLYVGWWAMLIILYDKELECKEGVHQSYHYERMHSFHMIAN